MRKKAIEHHHPAHHAQKRCHSQRQRHQRHAESQHFELGNAAIAFTGGVLTQLGFRCTLVFFASAVLCQAQGFKINRHFIILQQFQHRSLALTDERELWPRQKPHQGIAAANGVGHGNVLIKGPRTEKVEVASKKIVCARIRGAVVFKIVPFALCPRLVALQHKQAVLSQCDGFLLTVETIHQPAEADHACQRQHIACKEIVANADDQSHQHR